MASFLPSAMLLTGIALGILTFWTVMFLSMARRSQGDVTVWGPLLSAASMVIVAIALVVAAIWS